MARQFKYNCTQCGARPATTDLESKDLLTAKVIQFREVGQHGGTKQSRVVDWLCAECLAKDAAWQMGSRKVMDRVAIDPATGRTKR